MTEHTNSSELETVSVELTAIYLIVLSKNYRLHEVKANFGHKSSNLEQKGGYLFHPVYSIDF